MKTQIIAFAFLALTNITWGQIQVVTSENEYDLKIEESLWGVWYRHYAVYPTETVDSTYKSYEFFPDGQIIMVEVRGGEIDTIDYCTYYVKDTVLYLVTHFKDTALITDAVTLNHLDPENFVINSFFPGHHYDKTTFARRKKTKSLPKGLPPARDEEELRPGFAERVPQIFS